ncbi:MULTISPECIES: hypothetical protein [Thauera]|uniref:Uncharacterized protein n=1 Tax=Thauera chlorobenzoica TaxID=96773 RepID=A0A1H5VDW7_9RHOO|nr:MULTISPECIES: hypothetical protein [Thauera]APR06242.1 hypothetical protein Tchl_3442 [Thauera chlorobenzoica]MCK2086895.1 hypothetical protein [Thauera aromatica]MCK2127135.1 hypothetical protein [Thauera aromatica]SEF84991.1 hypothetical protein SAMN05216242_107119 [Thauera chlorobenzoica]
MRTDSSAPSTALLPLGLAWLFLVAMTVFSLWLVRWLGPASWVQLPLAAIIWLKGWVVARYFIESHQTHPFIAWVIRIFLLGVPLALVLTTWFGPQLAGLTAAR